VLIQLSGPFAYLLMLAITYPTTRSRGPLGDRRADRCALSAVPAASIDCRSGCRYRCVVVSEPCPAIFHSTCTGHPGVRHPRQPGMTQVVPAQMLIPQRADHLIPVRRVAEHRRANPAAAWADEQSAVR
jgi:hypothetical protein